MDDIARGLDESRRYWDGRARAPGTDLEKLAWSHERTQRMRFEAFLLEHEVDGRSVLDLGCGLGDFYAHLRRRGLAVTYTGFDLSRQMVRLCRARYPEAAFEQGNILEYEPAHRFDFTVAFGIHNIRVTAGREILELVTGRQFALARIAAHVSLLTDRASGFAPEIQAWRAEEVLAMALRITPHVVLRHDYLHNDFSVTLYQAPLEKRRDDLLLG